MVSVGRTQVAQMARALGRKLPDPLMEVKGIELPDVAIYNEIAKKALNSNPFTTVRPPGHIAKAQNDWQEVTPVIVQQADVPMYDNNIAFVDNAMLPPSRPGFKDGRRIVSYSTPDLQKTYYIMRGKTFTDAARKTSIANYGARNATSMLDEHTIRSALSYRPFPRAANIVAGYPVWSMRSPTTALRTLFGDTPLFDYWPTQRAQRTETTNP